MSDSLPKRASTPSAHTIKRVNSTVQPLEALADHSSRHLPDSTITTPLPKRRRLHSRHHCTINWAIPLDQSLENSMRVTLLVSEEQTWRNCILMTFRVRVTKHSQDLVNTKKIQLSAKLGFIALLQLGYQPKDKCLRRVRSCQDRARTITSMWLETTKNNLTSWLRVNLVSAKPMTDGRHQRRRSQLLRQILILPWIIWTRTTTLPSREVDRRLLAKAHIASSTNISTSRSSHLVQEPTTDLVTSAAPTDGSVQK